VHLEKDRARVWVPTQNQDGAQEAVARLTGLAYENIDITTTFLGGGFGRRGAVDYVYEAVRIAQKLNRPVKMIWTREEDVKNDHYRPASYNRMEAALDDQGRPTAWRMRIVGPDANAQEIPALLPTIGPYWVPRGVRNAAHWAGGKFMPKIMAGSGVKTGAVPFPYAIDNLLIEYVADDPGIPLGFWRSVGSSSTAFVIECFIDELAQAAEQDPVAFRLGLLKHLPRTQAVLKLAAEKAGWGTPSPAGIYRGAAVHEFHGTVVAMIADASIGDSGEIKIPRVVSAVDCGRAINPAIVKAQVSGGLIFGLTAALLGEVTLKNGQVQQSNFDDFPILTMAETPDIEVHLIDSQEPPTGIGETGVPPIAPPIAPAVANALSAAVGKRIRKLPIRLR
jgi:isoquinoline 1-oxidoreductase beta subunit